MIKDDVKLGQALNKLIDEDPSLHVRRDDATHETILSAVGESGILVDLYCRGRLVFIFMKGPVFP